MLEMWEEGEQLNLNKKVAKKTMISDGLFVRPFLAWRYAKVCMLTRSFQFNFLSSMMSSSRLGAACARSSIDEAAGLSVIPSRWRTFNLWENNGIGRSCRTSPIFPWVAYQLSFAGREWRNTSWFSLGLTRLIFSYEACEK
jgi:hypothetical protein